MVYRVIICLYFNSSRRLKTVTISRKTGINSCHLYNKLTELNNLNLVDFLRHDKKTREWFITEEGKELAEHFIRITDILKIFNDENKIHQ